MRLEIKNTAKEVYAIILKDLSAYGGFPFYGVVILASLFLNDFAFAYSLIAALIAVTLIVAAMRLFYFKPRPGVKEKKYDTIYEKIDNSSFPSIHAARSLMLSFAFYTKLPSLLPLYILMTIFVLLSRFYFKRHDTTDIIAGILLGLVLGYAFF